MTAEQIVILVLAVVTAALCIGVIALAFSRRSLIKRMSDNATYADRVRVRHGVRYSADNAVVKGGDINVSHAERDVILARGETYTAVRGGEIMPGTYTVLASGESAPTFKLRVGGLVRTYSHGDTLVLSEGEEICAVSCAVILR